MCEIHLRTHPAFSSKCYNTNYSSGLGDALPFTQKRTHFWTAVSFRKQQTLLLLHQMKVCDMVFDTQELNAAGCVLDHLDSIARALWLLVLPSRARQKHLNRDVKDISKSLRFAVLLILASIFFRNLFWRMTTAEISKFLCFEGRGWARKQDIRMLKYLLHVLCMSRVLISLSSLSLSALARHWPTFSDKMCGKTRRSWAFSLESMFVLMPS